MTLPVGPVPDGLTDMDIDALTAPLGIPLWPSERPDTVTLEFVSLVRGIGETYVEWSYVTGHTVAHKVGERVGIRVNLNDLRTAP